jgi:hypothetical protein
MRTVATSGVIVIGLTLYGKVNIPDKNRRPLEEKEQKTYKHYYSERVQGRIDIGRRGFFVDRDRKEHPFVGDLDHGTNQGEEKYEGTYSVDHSLSPVGKTGIKNIHPGMGLVKKNISPGEGVHCGSGQMMSSYSQTVD